MPKNQPGARRVDDRCVISGIIQVMKSGCRWRDCPQCRDCSPGEPGHPSPWKSRVATCF
ncbi:hypothetical protein ACELLULO517_27385 [Acidisoma cellulosilytica]|uniref:Transposase n=1 Tax=Acidisoma cellulosilyticum TaxID=2802395 RepID=A0A963Z7H8_9PROT|nr:hypothetical protein [Acidisoma cellulosilyticum]